MLAGAVIGGVAAWRAWQRYRLRSADQAGTDEARASGLAQTVGVAAIDPEPITQIAAEGIDLEARPAHPPRLDDVIGEDVRGRT